MYRSQTLLVVVTLFSFTAATSVSTNTLNRTMEIQKIWNDIKDGVPGLIPPFRSLHEDRIVVKTSAIKCRFSNVTLTGMDLCQIKEFLLHTADLVYLFIIRCPHFDITAHYSVTGTLDSKSINHNGTSHSVLDNYEVTLKGKYVKHINKNDNNTVFIELDFVIEKEVVEYTSVQTNSLNDKDTDKAESLRKYFVELWFDEVPTPPDPITKPSWTQFITSVNKYTTRNDQNNIQ